MTLRELPILVGWLTVGLVALSACGGEGDVPPRRFDGAAAPPAAEGATGTLVVTVTGFESEAGQALVALFLGPDGFPGEQQRAARAVELPIVDGRVEVVLADVPAGPFAISAFHDENKNFELDKGLFGIPSERWGVSRDAGGFLGPPSYDSAVLELKAGERLEVEVPLG